jgi:hypothetical protein
MSYDIVLGDLARKSLYRLPPKLADGLHSALERLAENPVERSHRSDFPYPFGQVHRFGLRHAGEVYLFAAHFYYGEDERTLRIFDLRFSREQLGGSSAR